MTYAGTYLTDAGITVSIECTGVEFYRLSANGQSWTLTLPQLKDAIATGRLTKVEETS